MESYIRIVQVLVVLFIFEPQSSAAAYGRRSLRGEMRKMSGTCVLEKEADADRLRKQLVFVAKN